MRPACSRSRLGPLTGSSSSVLSETGAQVGRVHFRFQVAQTSLALAGSSIVMIRSTSALSEVRANPLVRGAASVDSMMPIRP